MRTLLLLLTFFCSLSFGQTQPLPADQAFKLSLQLNQSHHLLKLNWQMAKDYYLYRDRIEIKQNDRKIKFSFPQSETLKKYQIYRNQLTLEVPYTIAEKITIKYQGCSESGFCYPPVSENFLVNQNNEIISLDLTSHEKSSDLNHLLEKLHQQKTIVILLTFFILGLLTSLTPCVLPMIPILLEIIVGQKNLTRQKAFFAASLYVLSVSIVYAVLGMIASALGINLNISLQNPIFLSITAIILILLALALFDWYHLHIPNQWLHQLSHRIPKHHYLGIIFLGIISSLILSPCVTPPLVAAILFMTQTHNLWLGGGSLFVMSLGIGTPLILIATFGAHYLPKKGKWMIRIKQFIGWLLIITAIFLLLRFIPIMQLFSSNQFKTVTQLSEIQYQLSQADITNKPIMLDIYADWCISCLVIEKTTLRDPTVQELLKKYNVIRVDITKNNQETQTILKQFNIIAPPTFIFFNTQGKEIPNSRIVGEIKSKPFIDHLIQMKN